MRSPLLFRLVFAALASPVVGPAGAVWGAGSPDDHRADARSVPAPPAADDVGSLAGAEQAYADLDYERCAREARGAESLSGARVERVRARLLQGLCLAALDDAVGARTAFVRMLSLDRDAKLPEGLSPRFTSAFLEARGEIADTPPLAVALLERREEAGVQVVRIEIHDPFGEVTRVLQRTSAGPIGGPLKAAPRMELELPVGADVEVVATDAAGGELASLWLRAPTPELPLAPGATAQLPPVSVTEPGLPWLAVSAGAGVLVAGVVVAGLWAASPARVQPVSRVVFGDAP